MAICEPAIRQSDITIVSNATIVARPINHKSVSGATSRGARTRRRLYPGVMLPSVMQVGARRVSFVCQAYDAGAKKITAPARAMRAPEY
jgi:hypothetical protein